ncbi:MAG: hypothetical protein ACQEWV_20860 [Bacillota bacterium]
MFERQKESIPFVQKSDLYVKRALAKVIYLEGKPIQQHLTKTEKK